MAAGDQHSAERKQRAKKLTSSIVQLSDKQSALAQNNTKITKQFPEVKKNHQPSNQPASLYRLTFDTRFLADERTILYSSLTHPFSFLGSLSFGSSTWSWSPGPGQIRKGMLHHHRHHRRVESSSGGLSSSWVLNRFVADAGLLHSFSLGWKRLYQQTDNSHCNCNVSVVHITAPLFCPISLFLKRLFHD